MKTLTQSQLMDVLDYNPDTGIFTWRIVAKKGQVFIGDEAGSHFCEGAKRTQISINGKRYLTHHLAWLYCYGRWPIGNYLDHRDGNCKNNRISNLREATHNQNMHNKKRCRRNKSGVKGVNWCSYRKKWRIKITVNNVTKSYGRYASLEEAAEVRRCLIEKLHGEFARFE